MRVGTGFDIHKLGKGRKLIIGGVTIPSECGEIAHSDGDVLLHAIIDAILGAYAAGDIGMLFPDTSKDTKDMDSAIMLRSVLSKLNAKLANIDSTVILENPKLSSYILEIRKNLAKLTNIPVENVSVKAKTAEGLGPIGERVAIAAGAVVLVEDN
ncbi:MAG: 2-C-methyl-D-erythritol 2,4-cyclodiphosphate synthase [Spirochaetes bacterium]|uniref:2-C-methyl-D-erythritol 2,4-cyclodiphosphate synthase n=1 Tax=Candidatus Ornithospirochaeta stercoripullorum TaxID=2840899 RepID=A0A9D9DZZ6_9SPIO|nr:2-C-methyl-D-erythritol 2,4-cyclodiphosphate synthase [Candidatus Ornithospirochaeta stercoripullorum]